MFKIGTFNKISPVGLNKLTDAYTLVENPDEAHGLILRSYDMHEMDFSDNLLAIGRAGAGTNNVPVDRCAEQGIVVFNAPGANANAVKELCVCGMILAARNVPEGYTWAKTLKGSEGVGKQIEKGKGQFAGTEIMGKTLGIIGLGAIGRLVADAAIALGMSVIGYDAFLTDAVREMLNPEITVADDLAKLYPECDYISIHVPANDATKGMMNAEAFAQMKDGVMFMNFARDKLMNDDDLLAALESGKVAKYVTDFADDAVLNADHPGIIVLPHLGASSAEAEDNCASMAVSQVMDYIENGNIVNSVNMPRVSLGKKTCPRLSVICKANAAADVLTKIAELELTNVASGTRGNYSYILADLGDKKADIKVAGVIRARVIE
ncbi:MAG: 3-phosphoglycerate dehydrogenase [Clostridia bacterium]|nr:3-phosphoglycerate dehydrogenase [Clostridia bacterium]